MFILSGRLRQVLLYWLRVSKGQPEKSVVAVVVVVVVVVVVYFVGDGIKRTVIFSVTVNPFICIR